MANPARTKGKGGKGKGSKPRLTASQMAGAQALAADEPTSDEEQRIADLLTAPTAAEQDEIAPEGSVDADATDLDAPPDLEEAKTRDPADIPQAVIRPPPPVLPRESVIEYGPDRTKHLSEAGLVCTTNWIGRLKGHRVSVKFGAPLSTIPHSVRVALADSGIKFAQATPPAGGGAKIAASPPRARRTPRREEEANRRFVPVRSLP